MHKSLSATAAFLLGCLAAIGQPKQYKLHQRAEQADIDQGAIQLLDTTTNGQSLQNAFRPRKGKYTVFVFIATYRGLSYNNREKEFHDIAVVKTNKRNTVLEAYQYTLEWAEMPLRTDLYKASAKAVTLVNGLPLESLLFQRVERVSGISPDLEEADVLLF